ncbi:MAG: PHP domain-containing protein [archaeon GBS-70-058]|nr:PHP domain-containing protein [Candidatus Culexarchaeum nevadense]
MRVDMHVHSCLSDGLSLPSKIAKSALGKVDGLAFTDHISSRDQLKLLEKRFRVYGSIKIDGLTIIPGFELSYDFGHVLAVFSDFNLSFPSRVFHDIWEFREFVKGCGGVVIAAHIFRSSGVGRRVFDLKEVFDALEVYPFNYDFDVYSLQIPLIAGSDSHTPYTVGFAYTYIPHSNCSADDIIQSIVKGRVLPVIRKPYILRKLIDVPHILSFLMPSKPCML